MTRQDQRVDGGEAYQAGNNVTVHRGMGPEQMSEIMIALAGQLATYLSKAEQIAQARYQELREELIQEFAKQNPKAKPEAFSDPDYQFVLREAHEAYARSGKKELRDELVKLLIERSNQPTGSRTALILNDAIRVSGSLTFEEVAVLAVVFVIKHVKVEAQTFEAATLAYESLLAPYVDNLTDKVFAFEYLESLGCVTIERVADHFPLDEHFYKTYSNLVPNASIAQLWEAFTIQSRSLKALDELWQKAFYKQTMLTALGKAIAHSALEGKSNLQAPLSIWVQ